MHSGCCIYELAYALHTCTAEIFTGHLHVDNNSTTCNGLQVVWSPTNALTCAVITQNNQLLFGYLGKELEAVNAIRHASCAAWSPDGCFLVYGHGDEVHFFDTATSTESWSTQIATEELQVRI